MEKDTDLLFTRAREWDVRTNSDIATQLIQKLDKVLDENPNYVFSISQEAGMLERAINAKFQDGVNTLMNPMFKVADRLKLSRELDRIDNKEYIVPRFTNVEVVYQDSLGRIRGMKLNDEAAMIMHQAMDMLDGVYPSDIGLEIIPEFDEASPEEQQQVIEEYFKTYINKIYSDLDNDLTSNNDTKDEWNAIKFMAAKSRGDVKIDNEEAPLSNRKKKFINKLAKQIKASKNKMKFWRKK